MSSSMLLQGIKARFSLRKGKVTRAPNKDDISSRQYLCSKAGARQPKFLIMEDKKRRPWPVTRFECPFEVVTRIFGTAFLRRTELGQLVSTFLYKMNSFFFTFELG